LKSNTVFSDKDFALSLEDTGYSDPENQKIYSREYCTFWR